MVKSKFHEYVIDKVCNQSTKTSNPVAKKQHILYLMCLVYYISRRRQLVKDKICPYCCKIINGVAARCPFCTSWLENDTRRRVESEFNENKSSVVGTHDGGLSTTTLGTSHGALKEKGSMDIMNGSNDATRLMTGAGVAAGATGGEGAVYNNNNNNMNSGVNMQSMNNGYMSNQNNLYTNPTPDQTQVGYDGLGVAHQPGDTGYDGMGVDEAGLSGDKGDLEEGGHGATSSSSSKPVGTL